MKFKEYNSIEEINNEILEYNSKIKPILSDVYNVIKPITEQYFIGYSPIECNSLCTEVIDTIDKFNLVEDKEELKNYIEYIKSSIYMLSHYLEALIESNKIRNLDVNTNINKLNIYYDIYNDLYKGLKNMIKN